MPQGHGVTLPLTDEEPVIKLGRAILDAYAVEDLAKHCALGLGKVLASPLGLAEVLPEIATAGLVTPDQRVDPLVSDAYTG